MDKRILYKNLHINAKTFFACVMKHNFIRQRETDPVNTTFYFLTILNFDLFYFLYQPIYFERFEMFFHAPMSVAYRNVGISNRNGKIRILYLK